MSFWFGEFELDQERRQLLRSGEPVPLEPKAYELLSLLLERRPRALSRAQIRDVVWPQTFVSESTLAVVVNGIRQALEDDARHPRFIRTVRGFGYAFGGEARESREGRAEARVAVEVRPYPGLLAFTEGDAERFFGREAEVEALWEKIRRHRLLAVLGPSGVGKTSFLRAGVIPNRPPGWSAVCATPGANPALALARALIRELPGQSEAIGDLLQGVQELSLSGGSDSALAAVTSWRKKSSDALLVVDQFEELFALNAPEMQARFASFLGRLVEEIDVHVLLSLRDDFLFRCGEQERLGSIFQDLTPLYPPSPDALRRALAEPARREGYRFEDDALVEEMVASVEGVKGALPLLAFAVARLWEERNREGKLLTRKAYESIRGVPGALAQHAEATLSRLGPEREGMVREVFRNLVTAQETRVAGDRAELLSVFGDQQEEAGAVLDGLVDARLLTEFEAPDIEGRGAAPGHRRIEIVHESLLTHWPRLVRWRTQDADGAQLRDQLRQAAHLWDERGRPDDLLWTGASYLDYGAWHARYSGRLTGLEEAFAQAMTALANRRRRRRRIAYAAGMTALAIGLGVVGLFWGRAEVARRQAAAEALRAEGSKLLALAQVELERYPTAALAYATKSLELADTEEARLLALRALQDGPTALVAPAAQEESLGTMSVAFDSKAEWLAVGGWRKVQLRHRDGRAPVVVEGEYPTRGTPVFHLGFGPNDDVLVAKQAHEVRLWSVPDARELRRLQFEEGPTQLFVRGHGLFVWTTAETQDIIRWAPVAEGESRLVGTMEVASARAIDGAGVLLAYAQGRDILVRSLENWTSPPRLVGEHPADVRSIAFHPDGRHLAASDKSGRIRIWSTEARAEEPLRALEAQGPIPRYLLYSPGGRWLAAYDVAPNLVRLWDLSAPLSSEPLQLRVPPKVFYDLAFEPSERWLATANDGELALWPLGERYSRSLGRHEWYVDDVAFTPAGSLVSASGLEDDTLRVRSLVDGVGSERILLRESLNYPRIAVDTRAERVAVSTDHGRVVVVPVAGGEARRFDGFSARVFGDTSVAFSPDGLRLAAAPATGPAEEKVIRVWDLESRTARVLGSLPGAGEGAAGGVSGLSFMDDGHIVASSPTTGILLFDLQGGGHTVLSSRPARAVVVGHRERVVFAALGAPDELVRVSLDGQAPVRVFSCPGCTSVALDPTEAVVATGSTEGIVRIGPTSGGEPHVLFSQIGSPQRVALSPDGRWVASSGERDHVRLWPVPEVTRTPLHRRSHEEVLAALRSWTNLRAVKDPQSPTGWKLEPGPFPGWAKLPRW